MAFVFRATKNISEQPSNQIGPGEYDVEIQPRPMQNLKAAFGSSNEQKITSGGEAAI